MPHRLATPRAHAAVTQNTRQAQHAAYQIDLQKPDRMPRKEFAVPVVRRGGSIQLSVGLGLHRSVAAVEELFELRKVDPPIMVGIDRTDERIELAVRKMQAKMVLKPTLKLEVT